MFIIIILPRTIDNASSFNKYSIRGAHTCPEPRINIVLSVGLMFEDLKEINLLADRKSLMYSNRSVNDPLLAIIAYTNVIYC